MKMLRGLLMCGLVVLLLSGCTQHKTLSGWMWRCTATDSRQEHWVRYAPTRIEAATWVRDRCERGSYRSTCVIHCLPPTVRWHCVAVDKVGHSWYWNSIDRAVARRNAFLACEKNTTHGRCRVPEANCSMT